MEDAKKDLEAILRSKNKREKKIYLHNVYRQIVPGRKSKSQSEGEYKKFVEMGLGNVGEFVSYVEKELLKCKLPNHAKRLHEYYSLRKPTKEDYD